MIKWVSALLLALAWALMLTACGGPEADSPVPPAGTEPVLSAAVEETPAQLPESKPSEVQPAETPQPTGAQPPESESPALAEDGWYSSKEEVTKVETS